jgi:hypothetical protein
LLDSGAQVSIKIINLGSKNFGNPSFQMVLWN